MDSVEKLSSRLDNLRSRRDSASDLAWLKERASHYERLMSGGVNKLPVAKLRELHQAAKRDWTQAQNRIGESGTDDDDHPEKGRPYSGVIQAAVGEIESEMDIAEQREQRKAKR